MSDVEGQPAASRWKPRFSLRVLGASLLAVAVIAIVFLGIKHLWRRTSEQRCQRSLEYFSHTLMICLMSTRGHLPPAYLMDSSGRPMQSWRASLVPFFDWDYGASGFTYRYEEPWDSPHNTSFENESRYYQYYSCPVHAAGSRSASYLCVVGGRLWPLPKTKAESWNTPSSQCRREGGVLPNRGKAILLVEVVGSEIPWTKPEDIDLAELVSLLRDDPRGDQFRRRIKNVVAVDARQPLYQAGPAEGVVEISETWKEALHILDPAQDLEEIRTLIESEVASTNKARRQSKSPLDGADRERVVN